MKLSKVFLEADRRLGAGEWTWLPRTRRADEPKGCGCTLNLCGTVEHALQRAGDLCIGLIPTLGAAINTDDVGAWNDTPGRTVEEVRAALRKAAVIATAEENAANAHQS